eukprot:2444387-Rhodomonas_salina.2
MVSFSLFCCMNASCRSLAASASAFARAASSAYRSLAPISSSKNILALPGIDVAPSWPCSQPSRHVRPERPDSKCVRWKVKSNDLQALDVLGLLCDGRVRLALRSPANNTCQHLRIAPTCSTPHRDKRRLTFAVLSCCKAPLTSSSRCSMRSTSSSRSCSCSLSCPSSSSVAFACSPPFRVSPPPPPPHPTGIPPRRTDRTLTFASSLSTWRLRRCTSAMFPAAPLVGVPPVPLPDTDPIRELSALPCGVIAGGVFFPVGGSGARCRGSEIGVDV